jgi:chemotaxis methyl-accepting protein methylase
VTVTETPPTAWFRRPTMWLPLVEYVRSLPNPATVYCGAVATGQEALSVAILLEHIGIPGQVIATDVEPELIALARAARFSRLEVEEAALAATLAGVMTTDEAMSYFDQVGGEWSPSEAVRARVSWSIAELSVDALPSADVVFVRNVWRHLGTEVRTHLADQLRSRLTHGAFTRHGRGRFLQRTTATHRLRSPTRRFHSHRTRWNLPPQLKPPEYPATGRGLDQSQGDVSSLPTLFFHQGYAPGRLICLL